MGLTYTVLAQQAYNAAASASSIDLKDASGNLLVDPATGKPIVGFDLYCPMNATDASTSGVVCRITCLASWDKGNSWEPFAGGVAFPYNWTGGIGPKGNYTVPSIGGISLPYDLNRGYADSINLVLDTRANQLNVGMQATLHS